MRAFIEEATDDKVVVHLSAGLHQYDYVTSALRIVLRTEDFRKFGINGKEALSIMQIEPELRLELMKPISGLLKSAGLVADGYNSGSHGSLFVNGSSIGFEPRLRFGSGQVHDHSERTLLNGLRQAGVYKQSPKYLQGTAIRVGVINVLGMDVPDSFFSTIRTDMRSFGFGIEVVGEEKPTDAGRADLERSIDLLRQCEPDIVLGFLPDQYEINDDESGGYYAFKNLTIGIGLPSQVIHRSTIGKQFAVPNIELGILGKTGNIPFVLADPLPYADLVVGIDIARESKTRLAGSISATAMTRFYLNDGEFLRYVLHDSPIEGETIPDVVLQSLFPLNVFQGKTAVIHRDGYFRGNEKLALGNWAKKIDARFHLVEVIKSGTPRLYAAAGVREISQPAAGNAFRLSATEAFLVSSLPPNRHATPQPLRIRTEPLLTIEQGIHSVLSLTLLHYGSVRAPKLPVDIHYSDRIAYLALRGVKPKNLEGTVPYWL